MVVNCPFKMKHKQFKAVLLVAYYGDTKVELLILVWYTIVAL